MPDLDELSIICALEQLRWSVYMSRAVVLQIFDLSIWCRSVEDANGPFRGLRECASASPEGSAAGMDNAQVNVMSAQPTVPLRSESGTRTLVKVR
jgi:hypothetical protein